MRVQVLGVGSAFAFTACASSFGMANGILVEDVALSTEAPAALGGNPSFGNDVLVGYDPDTDVAVNLFDLSDATGLSRNLDAAYELPNGNLVISTQAGGTIGTLDFTESDLVEIDRSNGTATMFLDSSAIGLTGNQNSAPNIDAVHVLDDGTILFSTAGLRGVTIGSNGYGQEDIIAYDPATQTNSLFFDGSLISGGIADLRAIAVIDVNHYLLAATDEGPVPVPEGTGDGGTADVPDQLTLGGLSFSRDDLIVYNPSNNTSTLFMVGLDEFSAPGEIIDAVTQAVVPEPASLALLSLGGLAFMTRRR